MALSKKLKTSFSLSTLLAAAALASGAVSSGCGKSSGETGCTSDKDCPPEQICINQGCITPPNTSDSYTANDTSSNSYYPKEPQEVLDDFVSTLKSGDFEGAVTTYFDPAVQKKYLDLFNNKIKSADLMKMAQQLEGAILAPEEEGKRFREYNVLVSGDSHEYPVQMFKLYEDGKEVWKIRGL